MNSQRLPCTDSIQELASFWDTHDLTAFDDELEEVSERVFERDAGIAVHLGIDEASAVCTILAPAPPPVGSPFARNCER